MQLQLASLFYTISLGTRTHYFGRTILHGGAKYRATGRGFVVEHKKFAENYRLYARTHFIKAIELSIILLVYAAYSPLAKSSLVYILMTISSWFLVTSWIISSFLFNPSGFDWLKTVNDFDDFMNWLWSRGGLFTKADQSWFTWWNEEQDHLRTTGWFTLFTSHSSTQETLVCHFSSLTCIKDVVTYLGSMYNYRFCYVPRNSLISLGEVS